MRKTKHETQFRNQNYKHEDLTPKFMTKSPLLCRQRRIAGQSSAVPNQKTQPKETNIFKSYKPYSPFQSPLKEKKTLSDEEILNSGLYKMLEEEILALIRRQESQFQKLDEMKQSKQKQIKQVKGQQKQIKLQIWQLRNETMELKEAIQIEHQQNMRLMEELGISEEDFQMYFRGQQGEEQSQNPQIQNQEGNNQFSNS